MIHFLTKHHPAVAIILAIVLSHVAALLCSAPARAVEPTDAEQAVVDSWYQAGFLGERVSAEKSQPFSTDVPFSFVYGGKPSSGLLPTWKRSVSTTKNDRGEPVQVVAYADPKTGLEVSCHATRYADFPAVDWTLFFTNRGKSDSPILEKVDAADVKFQASPEVPVVLHRIHGATANGVSDWLPFETPVTVGGQIDFTPLQGRSSKGATPFFNLQCGDQGVITAVGWTGQWRAGVGRNATGVRVTAGMRNLRLSLRPGENVRGPRVLQLYWQGADDYRGHNLFRQLMFKHVMPRVDGQVVTPPIAQTGTAFYEVDRGTEADQLAHLKSLEGLGFEYFWVDAFYGRDNFPTVGNYVLPVMRGFNQKRYPHGFTNIAKAIDRAGMKYIQWFEPERICPGTLMAKEHPEWVALPETGRWGMFNLAIPEAREYITKYLDDMVKNHGIDCLRFDNAVGYHTTPGYDQLWAKLDRADPDRVGINEIRYVEGLYRMWDDLLRANPGLFIDNCASGGQRIDLETSSRSIALWRTDATIHPLQTGDFQEAAMRNQIMTAGLSRYLPYHQSGQMGATPYLFRSAFNAGISFCEDCRPKDYPRDLLKQAIAEGKHLRKYYRGDFYPLTKVTTSHADWCVLQYHRPTQRDGMIMAFRRDKSTLASLEVKPRGIDPGAVHEVVRRESYEPSAPETLGGEALRKLAIGITSCPGSVVIEYKEKSTGKR